MQNELPYCLFVTFEVLKAGGVVVIGLLGAFIAYKQYQLGREKLKLDLYEKRYTVYAAVRNVLVRIVREGAFNASKDDPVREFDIATRDAEFLFENDLTDCLAGVRDRINKLITVAKVANQQPRPKDHQNHIDREHELFQAILEDLNSVPKKFDSYLNFRKLNTFL